jgi:hypothetical protein
MKSLILIFGCLLVVMPCGAAENQPAKEKQDQQQLEIEKYISRLKGEIEYYYQVRLIELKQRAEAEIRQLEIADKPVYASLFAQAEVAKAVLHINNYEYRATWYPAVETEKMLQFKKDKYELYGGFQDNIEKSSKLLQRPISKRKSEILAGKQFAEVQSRIAERKSRILAQLERETLNLQRQKEYALTVGLAEIEKQMKEDAMKPSPEETHGLVTGILYSADKPAAIIDHKIIHNGDKIYGAEVVEIGKHKVEFARNGKKWEQKVQEKPQSYWK